MIHVKIMAFLGGLQVVWLYFVTLEFSWLHTSILGWYRPPHLHVRACVGGLHCKPVVRGGWRDLSISQVVCHQIWCQECLKVTHSWVAGPPDRALVWSDSSDSSRSGSGRSRPVRPGETQNPAVLTSPGCHKVKRERVGMCLRDVDFSCVISEHQGILDLPPRGF